MNFRYEQAKDPRWTASGPVNQKDANTLYGIQSSLLGGKGQMPTVSSNGACQGITAWWLIRRALDQDFWGWFGPPKSASPQVKPEMGKAGQPVGAVKEVMNAQ